MNSATNSAPSVDEVHDMSVEGTFSLLGKLGKVLTLRDWSTNRVLGSSLTRILACHGLLSRSSNRNVCILRLGCT